MEKGNILESSNLKTRKERAITLIALVITIIVLLILAGVTVATLIGENGLLSKAQLAKERNIEAEQDEKDKLSSYENEINNYSTMPRTGGNTITISEDEYNMLRNANSFSTNEKKVGTWMDGKPLYKKTYQKTIAKNTNKNRQWIEVFKVGDDTPNIDHIHIDNGDSYLINGSNHIYPIAHTACDACYFTLRISTTGIVDFVVENCAWLDEGDNQLFLTVLYTKTTDTAPSAQTGN